MKKKKKKNKTIKENGHEALFNEDICFSVIITWSVCYSACAKVLCFTITNNLVPRVCVLCPAERETGTSEIIRFN